MNQSLWFAGEYTNNWEYGYAHGAYATGQRAVNAIMRCMDGTCPSLEPRKTMVKKCKEKDDSNGSSKDVTSILIFVNIILAIIFV